MKISKYSSLKRATVEESSLEDTDLLLGDMGLESCEDTSGSDMGCSQELQTDTLSRQEESKIWHREKEKDTVQEEGKERLVDRAGTGDGSLAMAEGGEDVETSKKVDV